MSQKRELIINAVANLLATDNVFPPAQLEEPEPSNFIAADPLNPSVSHVLSVQEGPTIVTRDGGRDDDFELEVEISIGYAVQAVDRITRRQVRDGAATRIEALIAANRTLGLTFSPLPYAEIRDATRNDNVFTDAGQPVATLIVTIAVAYVAASAAG
jgi:hypothetical protein